MTKTIFGLKNLKFRTKLSVIVGLTGLGFVFLILTNILIGRQVESELNKIHDSYIPMMELGPRLETQYTKFIRSLQDTVAAHDIEGLEATVELKNQFKDELLKATGTLDPATIKKLQIAIDEYYTVAYDVSRRLMKEETGVSIVEAMGTMKEKQAHVKKLLQQAIVFDKDKLATAFLAVSTSQKNAERLQLAISLLCLMTVTFFTLWIGKSVISSLSSLTEGFNRFSQGNFNHPIPVPEIRRDELDDVAHEANQMAKQIKNLLVKLAATNKELESFSYSVAHDLRAPLRASLGFSSALLEDYGPSLPEEAQEMIKRVATASQKMGELIDGLLSLSRISRNELVIGQVNLSTIVQSVLETIHYNEPERKVEVVIADNVMANGDQRLLYSVLENLLNNAWKFTKKTAAPKIEFGQSEVDGKTIYFIKDNGAGFDMQYSDKLFGTFQRLHTDAEFEGTGIGLATVQRIIERHHGKIWAKSEPGMGATFFFSLS